MRKNTFAWQTLGMPFQTLHLTRRNAPPVSWLHSENGLFPGESTVPRRVARISEPLSIYAVDDVPRLTELYTNLLESSGYAVTTFNDRGKALDSLASDRKKPSLLITDYIGLSMPIDEFMQRCRAICPDLRILMASGFGQQDMRPLQVKPDRFIQKPFTPEELRREVRAILNGE